MNPYSCQLYQKHLVPLRVHVQTLLDIYLNAFD